MGPSTNDGRRARLKEFGCDLALDTRDPKWPDKVKEATGGKAVDLMPNEFRLLRFLVEHPGRVFTRSQLIAALGKHDAPVDERTVDVWIGRLRRALRSSGAGDMLRTVRSVGYVLDLP